MRSFRRFTLIEVVVALAILSVSIASLLQLVMAAQRRIVKSYDSWMHTHMLMQAAEYYMLMPIEEPPEIMETFFPYPDYTVEHTYEEVEDLPEEYNNLPGQKPLTSLVLSLRKGSEAQPTDKIYIDRINYESSDSASAN